jgi:hypothetical protein
MVDTKILANSLAIGNALAVDLVSLEERNVRLLAELAQAQIERDTTRTEASFLRKQYDTACFDIVRLKQELEAEKAAHAATCESWKQDKDFRAATAPKHNGSLPERTIPRRQVQPPIEEMDT